MIPLFSKWTRGLFARDKPTWYSVNVLPACDHDSNRGFMYSRRVLVSLVDERIFEAVLRHTDTGQTWHALDPRGKAHIVEPLFWRELPPPPENRQ